jgi:hypothetical protein
MKDLPCSNLAVVRLHLVHVVCWFGHKVNTKPMQWRWPSQGTRQVRVDRPRAGGERLGVPNAWGSEAVPFT